MSEDVNSTRHYPNLYSLLEDSNMQKEKKPTKKKNTKPTRPHIDWDTAKAKDFRAWVF